MSSNQSPQELYQSCTTREEELNRTDLDRIRELVTKEVIFRPLFTIDYEPTSLAANANPRVREIDEAISRGNKYRDLVELLGKCKKSQARWLLLACWLRQEGICEPEEFLPKQMDLKLLSRSFWRVRGEKISSMWPMWKSGGRISQGC